MRRAILCAFGLVCGAVLMLAGALSLDLVARAVTFGMMFGGLALVAMAIRGSEGL